MTALPSGTVTFLFTDIEGSTPLWEQHPEAMAAALALHHALLRSAIEAHGGHIFNVAGDAICAAFATANDALAAAQAAQRGLHQVAWGDTPLRVRMGLHTGRAEGAADDYRSGPTLNRVARVMSAAYGGQILLSQVAADLVVRQLPEGIGLWDMGEHRLKGLSGSEHLWQVVAPDLPSGFPALKTFSSVPNNLPVQLTSFIGREQDTAEVQRLLAPSKAPTEEPAPTASHLGDARRPQRGRLDAVRLLTLTGAGGTGKTRLALEVAAEVLEHFAGGVWFVELAPLADPALLPLTIASVLGLHAEPAQPILATLLDYLRDKPLLLVLDNCEHLLDACARMADSVLHAAPHVQILATSREALGIAGEATYHVPSLPVPPLKGTLPLADLADYDSVRLFTARAVAVKSSFALGNLNAPAVAQICYRLDGIPLAIELAAARIKVFAPEQIAARLDDRFRLLTGGSRTALPRQQTLRSTIDWSYSLLSEPERILLRRLSVFADGWTFEAVEAVCTGEGIEVFEVLDLLTHLVEKSLVVAGERDGQARYHLLETIRQYARDKLLDSGEGSHVRTRHLAFTVHLAEEFSVHFAGPAQMRWLSRLEAEHDNVRAAIEWALESADILAGLRLAARLMWFWQQRYTGEGCDFMRELLARPEAAGRSPERARALWSRGTLEVWQGNHSLAQSLQEEALAIAKAGGDKALMASVLEQLGIIARVRKANPTARALLTEAVAIFRQVDDQWGLALALLNLGDIIHDTSDVDGAQALYVESAAILRRIDELTGLAVPLRRLGQLAVRRGDYEQAGASIGESLSLNVELGERRGVASCLAAAAAMGADQGRLSEAARLYGAADSLLHEVRTQMHPYDQEQYERNLATLRAHMDAAAFDAALAAGRALTFEQAVAEAEAISRPPL